MTLQLVTKLSPQMDLNKQPTLTLSMDHTDELEGFTGQTVIRQTQKPGLNERFLNVQKNTLNPILSPSTLQQLTKYVPVKTWATYTTLVSWISSISSNSPPDIAGGNCDELQHGLLVATLVVSFISAFASNFVQKSQSDPSSESIVYPPPKGFTATTRITHPKTNVTFPCKTKTGRHCWPVFDSQGNFVYDETRGLQALLLKDGATIEVGRRSRLFQSKKRSKVHAVVAIETDAISFPQLQPFWSGHIVGIQGVNYYLDFEPLVWAQASISVLAFATLSLFSPQVGKCLYPSVSNYTLSAVQTFLFFLIGAVTAFVMPDVTTKLSALVTQQFTVAAEDEDDNIPVDLYSVVERIVRIQKVSEGIDVKAR